MTSVQTATYDASKVGFNLGGWLGFRVADFPALGVDVRISKATPRFTASGGSEIDVSAGGLRVGGGVLLLFRSRLEANASGAASAGHPHGTLQASAMA